MKAYVELIQRKERELGTDMLTHQKVRVSAFPVLERGYVGGSNDGTQWSSADYVDNLMQTLTDGVSSTAAMGKGATDAQFTKSKLS
jgi:isocitrate lyase